MMKVIRFLLSTLVLVISLTSCQTYTAQVGLKRINLQGEGPLYVTKYVEIKENERLLKLEAQARYEEEQKVKQNLEAISKAMEKKGEINPYPNDISSITIPHIFRPVNSKTSISDSFTVFDTIIIPLGKELRDDENLNKILNSILDIKPEFIFLTGSLENQVNFAKLANIDAVTLNSGTVLFTPELESADKDIAVFKLNASKTLAISNVTEFFKNLSFSNIDIDAWHELSLQTQSERIKNLEPIVSAISQASILSLSTDEPSSSDWSLFTPYDYRKDFDWPLSDYLIENGFRDTYRETHFSEETDAGITREIENIKERFDFIYSKGLMEISSTTLVVAGLSSEKETVFATIATFIYP